MKHKIGLLNVGHAPRVDNKSLVANFFRSTGVDCEIIERATFEGETFEEIHKHLAQRQHHPVGGGDRPRQFRGPRVRFQHLRRD